MTTDEMMAHSAACIRRGKFESGDIEVINGLLALDCGPELVSQAVRPRNYDCAKSTMTSLEALARKSTDPALRLMIHFDVSYP